MRGGDRPVARRVVVPSGSVVVGSMVDVHPESGALYRSVLIHGPSALGSVELMVPVELAPLVSAAFAGRPASMPEPPGSSVVEPEVLWPAGALSAEQLAGTACVRCGGSPSESTPVGRVPGWGQVFACSPSCPPAGGAS